MSAHAVYIVEFGSDYSEIFTESNSGALDFLGLHSGSDATANLLKSAADYIPEGQETVLYFQNSFGPNPMYRERLTPATLRRIGESGELEPRVLAFFCRYPSFRMAQRRGDFIEAAATIAHSRKLKYYRPLSRYLARGTLFLIFALFWLSSFDVDKEKRLHELLEGKIQEAEGDIWSELYDFSKSEIESATVTAFRDEIATKLSEYLHEGRPLILPIVGEHFGGAIAELRKRCTAALDEGARRELTEGLTGTETRVRAWLETIRFTLQPEPWNHADPTAMSVLATFPAEGRTALAGYLRRDIAMYLTPVAQKGFQFDARLYRLDGETLELEVRKR